MSETACPACGADGVRACIGLGGADHPGRPPFFDSRTAEVLDIMSSTRCPHGTVETATAKCRDCIRERA